MRAINGLILVMILLITTVNLEGCATASTYMKKEDLTRVYNASRKEVFDAVIASAEELKWKVENTDPEAGMVYLHPPLNLLTSSLANAMQGGDIVEVKLVKLNDKSTEVFVEQKSRGELMDWGRAAGNINRLFKELDTRLGME